jgi:hypothetical protein
MVQNRQWRKSNGRRDPKPLRRRTALLGFEALESRTLLAVTPSVSGTTATFSGLPGDNLYLQTDNTGLLKYSSDGSVGSYSSNLGGSTLNLQAKSSTNQAQGFTINVYVGGTLNVGGIVTMGNSISIDGPAASTATTKPKAAVDVDGTIDTQGGGLTIQHFKSIEVGTTSNGTTTPATISTRNLGTGTNYATDPSKGDSGGLTLSVENPDPFNPILNDNFDFPQITVDTGSQLLAQADTGHEPGAVTLSAVNTNYTLDGLSFPTLQADVRSSAITLADGGAGQGVVIKGGSISIDSVSGDQPVVANLISNQQTQDEQNKPLDAAGLRQLPRRLHHGHSRPERPDHRQRRGRHRVAEHGRRAG